jgi:hypothetical protein
MKINNEQIIIIVIIEYYHNIPGVITEKISEGGRPNSSSIVFIARALSKQGTLSHSCCNSTIALGDKISGRIDKACPNLIKKGPRDTIVFLECTNCN